MKQNTVKSRSYEWSWVNPYLARAKDFPNLLSSAPGDQFEEAQIEEIRDWLKAFKAVFVEIGSGSGAHALELAANNPEKAIMAFEKRYKRAVRTAEKALERDIQNLHICRCDFKEIFKILGPESIEGLFCNFPDPWSKKHWKKHRMLSPENLPNLKTLLSPNGFLSVKTDHDGFASDLLEELEQKKFFPEVSYHSDLHSLPKSYESNHWTEFERLFQSKAKNVHCFVLRKKGQELLPHPYIDESELTKRL